MIKWLKTYSLANFSFTIMFLGKVVNFRIKNISLTIQFKKLRSVRKVVVKQQTGFKTAYDDVIKKPAFIVNVLWLVTIKVQYSQHIGKNQALVKL